jgi:hypothetical protein
VAWVAGGLGVLALAVLLARALSDAAHAMPAAVVQTLKSLINVAA